MASADQPERAAPGSFSLRQIAGRARRDLSSSRSTTAMDSSGLAQAVFPRPVHFSAHLWSCVHARRPKAGLGIGTQFSCSCKEARMMSTLSPRQPTHSSALQTIDVHQWTGEPSKGCQMNSSAPVSPRRLASRSAASATADSVLRNAFVILPVCRTREGRNLQRGKERGARHRAPEPIAAGNVPVGKVSNRKDAASLFLRVDARRR